MNTYDPADFIVYRQIPRQTDRFAGPMPRHPDRLPSGYPNKAWRTRIAPHEH